MKKTSKRICALLIALCLLASVLPMQILAEEQSSFDGQQLFLGDDLNMHFYASISDSHKQTGLMSITVGGEAAATYMVSQMTPDKNGKYDFSVNLGAPEMTETITLTLTAGGSKVMQKSYSIREYAQYLLDGNYSKETKDLVLQMLNYGTKAQLYFDNKTGDLANAGNEIQSTQQLPAAMPEIEVIGSVSGVQYYGSSMVFRSKVALRHYFNISGNAKSYIFVVDGKTYEPISKDGFYYIEVADINPQDMEKDMSVSVTDGIGILSFGYSPMDYIVRMYNKADSAQALKNMLLAANGYFQAAKVFEGVKSPVPTFSVSDTATKAGNQITVTVDFENNPGLLGTLLTLTYDEDVLTLTAAKNGSVLSGLSYMKPSRFKSGCNFVWYGNNSSPAVDGTVLTLTFTVAADAPAGSYQIGLECSESDTFDGQNNPLVAEALAGTVTVS